MWPVMGAAALAACAVAAGCSPQEKQQMARESARTSGAIVDTGGRAATIYRADSGRVPGTHMDTRLEAPTQIPALQQRLDSMQKDPGYLERSGYAGGYKNLLADVVNAMGADLSRVGQADSGAFRTLSDSVVNDVGGGTGAATAELKADKVPAHVQRVRRLIAMYERATHASLNPSATPARPSRGAGDSAARKR
jgi:hypothetical protein